ncbi:MAG: aminomethyl-transferring glycine dehydrogenase subunit GcvPA [Coriobacteriia bacterium]|nr:aminomethyl-transferring glycine dehydrogenase subunit GcvPA [Coriobacteriia bacterium]
MRFVPVTEAQREAMLRVVGVSSVDELFADIPECVRFGRELDIPDGLSEMDLAAHLDGLSRANVHAGDMVSFLGAGCYDHYIPSIVDNVLRKPEFFTAYTPYQPEVSQGTLQAIYEFQSMVCSLTGMDVANASMYDGATAFVEGAYLAVHQTKRTRVVVSATVHPEWRETLSTYALAGLLEVVEAPASEGVTDVAALSELAADAAAVMIADPNFYGCLEDVRAIQEVAAEAGALLVVAVNPVLLGVLEPPSAYGADVVVAEGQPLGNAMSYGGPGLGIFSCREEYLRRMPGRIVGRTVDADGATAFVLTMQTREQHIRREKATSNICSNHALNALAACVYLSSMGASGLRDVGEACIAKAHYLHDALVATGRFEDVFAAPFAHEFAVRYSGDAATMRSKMFERGFIAGLDLGRFEGGLGDCVLFAVTERRTHAQIDAFVQAVSTL